MNESRLTSAPAPSAGPARAPRRRRFVRKLTAVFVALLFSFLLCEIAARIVFPAPPDPAREPRIVYVRSDELGYLFKPNQRGWIDNGEVTINSLGFRGAEPKIPRPDGLYRLMVIGSSNTAGWGVHDDQTYCAELERRLPQAFPGRQVEVLNWAVNGYKMHRKEQLLRYGLALRPDLLLVDFSDYDLFEFDELDASGGEARPAEEVAIDGQPFRLPHEPGEEFQLVGPPSWANRLLRRSRAAYVAKNGLSGLKVALGTRESRVATELAVLEGRDLPELEETWRKVDASLGRIRALTEQMPGRVGLLVFPLRSQVAKDYPNAQYQVRLAALAEKYGFFVIDPLPRFREHANRVNELFIPYDRGHPGPLGHQLIAEAVFETVRDRQHRVE